MKQIAVLNGFDEKILDRIINEKKNCIKKIKNIIKLRG